MNQASELSVRHMELLRNNSAVFGGTPSAMLGRLLDDEFGGLRIGPMAGNSLNAIQQQIESLEAMLRPRPR